MASLFNTKISNTYVGLLKMSDNLILSSSLREISDGSGNGAGVYLNTSGDLKATGILEFGSLKDTGENITISKFVDEADGIANNDNDTTIPTSAAIVDYVASRITLEDLDFSGDSGTGSVDLDSQTFAIVGTANEIETSAGSQQLQIGLPSNVTISSNLQINGLLKGNNNIVIKDTSDRTMAAFYGGNKSEIYFNDSKKFETTSDGVTITGGLTATASSTFTSASFSGTITGVANLSDGSTAVTQSINDNSTKIATTAYVDASVDTVDTLSEILAVGNTTGGTNIAVSANDDITFTDTSKAIFGDGNDLSIYHTANSFIYNTTGDLVLEQTVNDQDIVFKSDDGSGGTTEYFKLDGSTVENYFSQDIKIIDSKIIKVGNSNDLKIFHDGTDSVIQNDSGNLEIQNRQNDGDIVFKSDDGSGGVTTYISIDGSDVITKIHKQLRFLDNVKGTFGNSDDLQIYHDGSNSYIVDTGTGDLNIQADNNINIKKAGGGETKAVFTSDGGVDLYYDNSKKLETTTTGITVTGIAVADGLDIGDDEKIRLGDSQDLEIYHDGTNSIIEDTGTGDLHIIGDNDIVFKDGSGNILANMNAINSVELNFAGSNKFATTNTGVSVTGTIVASGATETTGITITSTSPQIRFTETDTTPDFRIRQSAGSLRVQYASDGSSFSDYLAMGANSATFAQSVIISGDLTVNGTTTTVNTQTLAVEDPLISLAKDNSANSVDIGFYGRYNDGSDKYLGLFADASDSNTFKLFKGTGTEPTTTVDTTASGYALADLDIANLTTTEDISIAVAKKLYFGGGSHTYISEDVDDRLRIFCGGDEHIRLTAGGNGDQTDFYRPTFFHNTITLSKTNNAIIDLNTTTSDANTTVRFREGSVNQATVGYDGTNDGLILTTGGFTAGNGIFVDDSQNVGFNIIPTRDIHLHRATLPDIHITNNDTGTSSGDGVTLTLDALDFLVQNREAGNIIFKTSGAEKLRIDSNGNIGINVVAQNSGGTWRNFQLGGGNITTRASANNGMLLGTGYYFTSTDTELYKNTAAVSRIYFNNNEIRFQNAASGTAGDPITWSTPLILDGSGNLLLDSDSTKLKLGADQDTEIYHTGSHFFNDTTVGTTYIRNTGANSSGIIIRNDDNGDIHIDNDAAGEFQVSTNNSQRFTITSGGKVGINNNSPDSQLAIGGDFTATTLKPTLAIVDTTSGGILGIRGQSPILAFDRTASGTPKILMDGGGLQFKDGTLDTQGSIQFELKDDGTNRLVGNTTIDDGTIEVVASAGSGQPSQLKLTGRNTSGYGSTAVAKTEIRSVINGTGNAYATNQLFYTTDTTNTLNEVFVLTNDGEVYNSKSGTDFNTAYGRAAGTVAATGTKNTTIGYNVGHNLSSGEFNTLIGADAGISTITGDGNTGVGVSALQNLTSGTNNVAVGKNALDAITTGANNIAIGQASLSTMTTQQHNVAVGRAAMQNCTGQYNIGVGTDALELVTGDQNTAVGYRTQLFNQGGNYNVSMGGQALRENVSGSGNTAIGTSAGFSILSSDNTVLGYLSGYAITSGTRNTSIGRSAMENGSVTGNDNLAVGHNTMNSLTGGADNVAIGNYSTDALTTGSDNVAVGYGSLSTGTSTSQMTAIGKQALLTASTGNSIVAVGHRALRNDATPEESVAVGATALENQTGGRNHAFGFRSLKDLTTGNYNTSVGGENSENVTTGDFNTSVGAFGSRTLTTGDANVGLGYQALYSNVSGSRSVGLGFQALYSNTASDNIAVGHEAGRNITDGYRNVLIGDRAGQGVGSGFENCYIGHQSGFNVTGGNYNTALGVFALRDGTTADRCTGIGRSALIANTSGDFNTAIGMSSGEANTTGSNNTFLGYNAGTSHTTGSNVTIVGNNAQGSSATVSNEITLGNSSVSTLRCQVTSITSLSDKRDKKDIKDSNYGLNVIDSIRPVTFTWDNRDESENKGKKDVGFIAQELKEIDDDFLRLVYSENPEKLEATYGRLIPVMVKAIQELKAEVDNLKNKCNCK